VDEYDFKDVEKLVARAIFSKLFGDRTFLFSGLLLV